MRARSPDRHDKALPIFDWSSQSHLPGFRFPEAKAAKRYSDAIASYRRGSDIRADYPEAWNELEYALRQTGQYAETIKAYDRALRLRPNFPKALEYLGEADVKMGKLDDAKAILARLVRWTPGAPGSWTTLSGTDNSCRGAWEHGSIDPSDALAADPPRE